MPWIMVIARAGTLILPLAGIAYILFIIILFFLYYLILFLLLDMQNYISKFIFVLYQEDSPSIQFTS